MQPKLHTPKNANSDCCYTKLNKIGENSAYPPSWNLHFYQIQNRQIAKEKQPSIKTESSSRYLVNSFLCSMYSISLFRGVVKRKSKI